MPDRGTALVNTVRIYDVDGTNPADVTRAEIEGRRQQRLLLEFARKFVPDSRTPTSWIPQATSGCARRGASSAATC